MKFPEQFTLPTRDTHDEIDSDSESIVDRGCLRNLM